MIACTRLGRPLAGAYWLLPATSRAFLAASIAKSGGEYEKNPWPRLAFLRPDSCSAAAAVSLIKDQMSLPPTWKYGLWDGRDMDREIHKDE
ncbi:hypothetical protein OGAPHI_001863 [Ogataea philodendri]|uniref:Uncharacterized protein n=1 Tax=Ogataea philodendri TaxID=1378263 RepID=A0A9P8PAW2_9ASCO|nr:uncharacterized protein OGAPHI_001863 [Ogataea philodendri]KAH3668109.1 hypothetical protein OGAPHI_001863 [Ogataea philodendri]